MNDSTLPTTANRLCIGGVPALVWGAPSQSIGIAVHGRMASKADPTIRLFAETAARHGWQTLSFDLTNHGERMRDETRAYDIPLESSVDELRMIVRYAQSHWRHIAVFGNSIGAWLVLIALHGEPLETAWLLSPVVDMQGMLDTMLRGAASTLTQLRLRRMLDTPMGTLRYVDYRYVQSHPVGDWPVPTAILHARDDMVSPVSAVEDFARRFPVCRLTVEPDAEHWFHTDDQLAAMRDWLESGWRSLALQ